MLKNHKYVIEKKLNMIEVLKNLVAADSECDCVAHLLAVQNFLLIFREIDSINYLQYGSLYLESMHLLPEEHQEIYTKLMQGHLMVKKDTSHIMLSQAI